MTIEDILKEELEEWIKRNRKWVTLGYDVTVALILGFIVYLLVSFLT